MFRYSMQLFWSEEDGEYVALIPEFPHLSALANTPEEAAREAQVAAGLFLEDMAAVGEEAPEPQTLSRFSGQMRVRMPRTLHQKLAGRARMEDVSLNTLIVSLLAEGMGTVAESPLAERKTRRPKRGVTRAAASDATPGPQPVVAAKGEARL